MSRNVQVPVICALIRNQAGQILLQRRTDAFIPAADNCWEFTGGRLEFGEKPEDAVMRECFEEIGCKVKVKRLVPHIQSNMWERADNTTAQALVICYEVEIVAGEPRPLDKKVAEVSWFTVEEVKQVKVLPGIVEFVTAALTAT